MLKIIGCWINLCVPMHDNDNGDDGGISDKGDG